MSEVGVVDAIAAAEHVHTPELRERRHYDSSVILADAWVCAECEAFLGRVAVVRGAESGEKP